MAIETTRIISDEIRNQVARRIHEIKSSLDFQIQNAISTAIEEKVLPSIQNTLIMQGRTNCNVMDRRSSGLQGSRGAENPQKSWTNRHKSDITLRNCGLVSRESSADSHASEQNRDSYHSKFRKLYL